MTNPVYVALFWAQVVGVAIVAKTYLPAAARWNLLWLCAFVVAAETVGLFLVLFARALMT